MQRYMLLLGCGLLAIFYLYILSLASNPQVSIEYKLYYIDQKLKYWPEKNGLNYQLGTPIYFNHQHKVVNLSRNGWSEPEQQGVRATGHESALYLALTDPDEISDQMRLVLNAIPIIHKNHPGLNISITINDEKIGEHEYKMGDANHLSGVYNTHYDFPSNLINKDTLLRIEIKITNPVSLKPLNSTNDSRLSGIMVKSISLSSI